MIILEKYVRHKTTKSEYVSTSLTQHIPLPDGDGDAAAETDADGLPVGEPAAEDISI